MSEDRENALAAGCTGYLSKPFTRAELIAALEPVVRLPIQQAAI
jgi:CheY-like chemotaxis protein